MNTEKENLLKLVDFYSTAISIKKQYKNIQKNKNMKKLTTDEALLKAIETPQAQRKYSLDYLRMVKLRTLKGLITLDKKIEILENLGYRATELTWTEPKQTESGKKPSTETLSRLLSKASEKLQIPLSECKRLFGNHTVTEWEQLLGESIEN